MWCRFLRSVVCLSLGIAMWASISQLAGGQTLSQMRSEVRSSGNESKSTKSKKDKKKSKPSGSKASRSGRVHFHHDDDDDDDDDDDENPLADFGAAILGPPLLIAGAAATVPFWGPAYALEDGSIGNSGYFPEHPYANREFPGYMYIIPNLPEDHWHYGGHFQADYGDSFDSLTGIGGRLVLDSSFRLGFDTELTYRREELAFQIDDDLWTGDANVTIRIAQHPRLIMRTGLGVNWFSDQFGTDFGINFTYGAEWFMHDPFVVTAGIDWGRVGESGTFHFRTEIGMAIEQFEPFIGFDHYSIGSAGIQEAVAGVRIWF